MLKDLPPYRLRKVTFGRFKAVCSEQAVQLTPFTVLIGRNGSGKSTLVEALRWIDTALRRDANAACDPYRGMRDLINKRSKTQSFLIELSWTPEPEEPEPEAQRQPLDEICYSLSVGAEEHKAIIEHEQLWTSRSGVTKSWLMTELHFPFNPQSLRFVKQHRERMLFIEQGDRGRTLFLSPDRPALPLGPIDADDFPENPIPIVRVFFRDAVFLRLAPKSLSTPTRTTRSSDEPILDEEGARLAALLRELTPEQLAEVIEQLKQILPDVREVGLSDTGSLDLPIHYHLTEEMPGLDKPASLPAWMLSEGTRRLTALFALLARDPPPSLLCIEEIENGLDPWTVVVVLNALRSAVTRGVQVLVTTHSPWLLDHARLDEIVRVRRQDGETRYERFADDEEVKKFRDGVPPGMRYVKGG